VENIIWFAMLVSERCAAPTHTLRRWAGFYNHIGSIPPAAIRHRLDAHRAVHGMGESSWGFEWRECASFLFHKSGAACSPSSHTVRETGMPGSSMALRRRLLCRCDELKITLANFLQVACYCST
jgi:hypothetical protein